MRMPRLLCFLLLAVLCGCGGPRPSAPEAGEAEPENRGDPGLELRIGLSRCWEFEFSPDGRHLAAAGWKDGKHRIVVWDYKAGRTVKEWLSDDQFSLALSPAGSSSPRQRAIRLP